MGMPCVTRVAHGFLLNGVVRGGGWYSPAREFRVGQRYSTGIVHSLTHDRVGFRSGWCSPRRDVWRAEQ